MKGEVDQAVRATKVAWLLESKRVNVTGEDISDERLKQLYCRSGARGPVTLRAEDLASLCASAEPRRSTGTASRSRTDVGLEV